MKLYRVDNGFCGDGGGVHILVLARNQESAMRLAIKAFTAEREAYNASGPPSGRYGKAYCDAKNFHVVQLLANTRLPWVSEVGMSSGCQAARAAS